MTSWLLATMLALAGGSPSDPLGEDASDEEVMEAVVLLQTGSTTCTGAFVGADGTIATAYHCVAPGGRPQITTRDGRTARGRVVASKVSSDLAVIAAPGLAGSPWLAMSETLPELGDPVRAFGHPFGANEPYGFMEGTLRWSVSSGTVSAVGRRALQFTAPVNPGNSGGPVVSESNELVAVVSRRLSGDGLGFGGQAATLRRLVDEQAGGQRAIGGTIGLNGWVASWQAFSVSVGPQLEVAIRDRVVFSLAGALPLSPRWDAVRFDEITFVSAEGRLSLRQRLFLGRWTTRVDAWAAVARIGTLRQEELSFEREGRFAPMFGGTVALRSLGLEGAATLDGSFRIGVVVRWPGTFWIF